ncbi:MAG: nuclear transport factor 2 family protein [Gammaproteobacteria bacterium]|nr:nuclear transport factor 2 family protein [Gammaproteobacteria bacterium]
MALSLEDRFAISELLARYFHATDARDCDAIAAMFAPDGVLEVEGSWQARGREQIADAERPVHPRAPRRHLVNSLVIDGNGSTASCTASVAVVEAGGTLRVSGRFVSKLAKRREGGWQLVQQRYENIEPRPSWAEPEDDGSLSAADRVAIMDVIYRAGRTVDGRDPEGRADCYTDDAVYEYEGGDKTVGREEFIRKLRNAADPHDSLHWTTNHIIEGTNTEAKGHMYFAVYYQEAIAATGTYSDTYRKVGGDWRIASRYVVVDRAP